MTPYYADDWLTVYHGDARAVMAEMEPESVHCVVTSPPYWGLRDYGTATWVGGDEACAHAKDRSTGIASSGLEGGKATTNHQHEASYRRTCGKCGAIRQDGQLGLEPTPEAYVESLVAVFREVRRVLRSDGTVWLNLGDSYAAERGGTHQPAETLAGGRHGKTIDGERVNRGRADAYSPTRNARGIGLKHKDLVGIPWRVAFALQADGWYLRSDIIWAKPNPMPESVTDRPTKSHEYLFLLSKSARYYFDADAVREEQSDWTFARGHVTATANGVGDGTKAGLNPAGRNLRSVWTIATQPYPGAHFATFPSKLVEPCIKAGTSEYGVCPECGAPWVRQTERTTRFMGGSGRAGRSAEWVNSRGKWRNGGAAGNANIKLAPVVDVETTGWEPSCRHVSPLLPQPAVVLDPFAGSGTTGMVAQSLSRRAVLIDLSMDYLGQLMDRNRDIPLGLGA